VPDAVLSLVDLFAKVLEEPAEALNDQSSRDTTGNWTSMRHVALMVAIENEYKIRFSNPEMASLRSLGAVRASLIAKGVVGL
jgi:acyl carrier protein